jgi:hypothetical protein
MGKRAYKRFITGFRCDIYSAIADKVKIKDISISGICLETSRRINIKSIYSMNFVAKEIGEKTLKGRVVWSTLRRSIKDNFDIIPIYHVGIKFIELNDGKRYLEKLTESLAN